MTRLESKFELLTDSILEFLVNSSIIPSMAKDISIRFEDDTYTAIKAAAVAARRPIAAFLRVVIEDHLEELAELERQTSESPTPPKPGRKPKAGGLNTEHPAHGANLM